VAVVRDGHKVARRAQTDSMKGSDLSRDEQCWDEEWQRRLDWTSERMVRHGELSRSVKRESHRFPGWLRPKIGRDSRLAVAGHLSPLRPWQQAKCSPDATAADQATGRAGWRATARTGVVRGTGQTQAAILEIARHPTCGDYLTP
jgi:hypothetical protein